MNTVYRRSVLGVTIVLGLYVGVWAQFFPHAFYVSFPGFGLQWISVDGPENEHLIRDIGSLNLALTAISVAGFVSRRAEVGRVAGLAWAVFGILHIAYHANHLFGAPIDIFGTAFSIGISAIFGVLLLFPTRQSSAALEAGS